MTQLRIPRFSLTLLACAYGCSSSPDNDQDPATSGPVGSTTQSDASTSGSASADDSGTADSTDNGGATSDSSTASEASSTSTASTGDRADGESTDTTGDDGGFAIACDDVAFPVWVEGGGGYDTVQDAVDAAEPSGTVYVCPGVYEETIVSRWPITVVGPSPRQVTVQSSEVTQAVFELVAPATLEGMTISGGRVGVQLSSITDDLSRLEQLRVEGAQDRGITLLGVESSAARVDLHDVSVGDIADGGLPGAGIFFEDVDAELHDCTISSTSTTQEGGGLYIRDSDVLFMGGAVVSNSAAMGGGGVFLDRTLTGESTLQIVGSDWGAGAVDENDRDDALCDGGTSYSFFGADTDAMCTIINGGPPGCCQLE